MGRLTFAMNVSLDGYVAAPGDDLGWSVPSDELFQWWSDRVASTDLALYGRRMWEAMHPHWSAADEQPDVLPAHAEYARRWQAMPKVVFSSTLSEVDGARLHSGDAVEEIARLKERTDGNLDVLGATLAASAIRAGLVDEFVLVTAPVIVGGGTPFFPSVDTWTHLDLVETRTFDGGLLLSRYVRRG